MRLSVPREVQVHQVHLDLGLEAHDVGNDLGWAEYVLKN